MQEAARLAINSGPAGLSRALQAARSLSQLGAEQLQARSTHGDMHEHFLGFEHLGAFDSSYFKHRRVGRQLGGDFFTALELWTQP